MALSDPAVTIEAGVVVIDVAQFYLRMAAAFGCALALGIVGAVGYDIWYCWLEDRRRRRYWSRWLAKRQRRE